MVSPLSDSLLSFVPLSASSDTNGNTEASLRFWWTGWKRLIFPSAADTLYDSHCITVVRFAFNAKARLNTCDACGHVWLAHGSLATRGRQPHMCPCCALERLWPWSRHILYHKRIPAWKGGRYGKNITLYNYVLIQFITQYTKYIPILSQNKKINHYLTKCTNETLMSHLNMAIKWYNSLSYN